MSANVVLPFQFRQDDVFLASPSHAVPPTTWSTPTGHQATSFTARMDRTRGVFVVRYKDNGWISSLFVQPKDTLKKSGGSPSGGEIATGFRRAKRTTTMRTAKRVAHGCSSCSFHRGASTQGPCLVEVAVRRACAANGWRGPVAVEDPSGHLAPIEEILLEIDQMVLQAKSQASHMNLAMRHSRLGPGIAQSIIEFLLLYVVSLVYPSIVGCGENAILHHDQSRCVRER